MDPITFHPRVGAPALELVKRFEGFRASSTPLPGGGFVVGYGHVLARDLGRAMTPPEGEALLRYDLSRLAARIEPLVLAPVSDAQFDTLLSFAFGVGVPAFAASAVLKRLNAGAYLDAAAALELWRVAQVDGEALVVDVLVRRRAVEKAHFLEPPQGFTPAPSALLRPSQDEAALAAVEALAVAPASVARIALADDGAPVRRSGVAEEPAPSMALAAVAALSARLDQVFAAAEPPPPPVVQPVVAPAPEHPAEPTADPQPANDRGPPPPAAPPEVAETAPGRGASRVSLPSLRGPVILMGLVGLAVFALAVFRIYKAPSLGGLALGVLGVIAMAPAAMRLATPRPRDDG